MRIIVVILLLSFNTVFTQSSVSATFLKEEPLKVDHLVGLDSFDTRFYINGITFYKKSNTMTYDYSNVQLDAISYADTFNPLKSVLFYQDFNTIIVLDNRLAEITKTDFNVLSPLRLVTHISSGNDNTIWLFNQNTLQIELFDYLERKTRITSLPISSEVLALESNYAHCWVLTKDFIYKYHYTGGLIYKIVNDGYTQLKENNNNIFLLKDKSIFYKPKNSDEISLLFSSELLINQFLVTNETLYIYNEGNLQQYQLKTD